MMGNWDCCCACAPIVLDNFITQGVLDEQSETIEPDVVDLTEFFSQPLTNLGIDLGCIGCTRWRLYETGFTFWYAGWQPNVAPDCAAANGGLLDAQGRLILADHVPYVPGSDEAGLTVSGGRVLFTSEFVYQGFLRLELGCCDDDSGQGVVTWPAL